MKQSNNYSNTFQDVSVVRDSVTYEHAVDFSSLDLSKVSAINTFNGNRYSALDWKINLHKLEFNGKYNVRTLLLVKQGEGLNVEVELRPEDVMSIEYVRVEVYVPKKFIQLSMSDSDWSSAISWMRDNGWKDDHELIIIDKLYYLWNHRVPDYAKESSKDYLQILLFYIQGKNDVGKGSKFILKASCDESDQIHVASDLNEWKSWIQISSNNDWGTNVKVHVLGPDGVNVLVPKEFSWSFREYLHKCGALFDVILKDDFTLTKLNYLSTVGLTRYIFHSLSGRSFI